MHNLSTNFNKFLATTKWVFPDKINAHRNLEFYPNKPKMSDMQAGSEQATTMPEVKVLFGGNFDVLRQLSSQELKR